MDIEMNSQQLLLAEKYLTEALDILREVDSDGTVVNSEIRDRVRTLIASLIVLEFSE